ncbi:ligand-binding sensor domain-containing diguanylate cyclase [Rhodoferax sp. PAMC 29310]|uniref:ligand-binding sensor domain-containing diguanylate cyclase n=1 Tax=Rhodoferax sp. PAMC 29310 TaxID=2822760 RepID=UPI001B33C011|nr:ligand-binding sensor domain-containing diguanylate cyclase [Rhodoferax sp. PAMC 29310]
MRLLLQFLSLAILLVSTTASAEPARAFMSQNPLAVPRFETVGAGVIPRDVVPTLAQDKAGFLWVATGDGLVRYDGYRFRPLERDSVVPTRRNLGWIRALLPARDGRLWIGTETDGLAVYDPVLEQVTDYRLGGANGVAVPTVRALAEDQDGSIWVGSVGGGVARLDPVRGTFTTYRHSSQPGSLPDDRVQALLMDSEGTLWVGTWAGLSRLKRGSEVFEPVLSAGIAPLVGQLVQALYQSADGRIWAGTQQGRVMVIDPLTLKGEVLLGSKHLAAPSVNAVSSFVEVPGRGMWVGRSDGIEIYDPSLVLVSQLKHDIRQRSGLAGNEVTTLVRDQAGWIWVGGFGLGLQRHNPNNLSIWLRGADLTLGSRLDGPSVRSLLQVDNGEIWAASHRGGAAVMDSRLRVIGEVAPPIRGSRVHRAGVPAASADGSTAMVNAMAQTRNGSVWLGTATQLFEYGRNRQLLSTLHTGVGEIRRMLATSNGMLWIGTADGLYVFRPGIRSLVRVTLKAGVARLDGGIHALAEAPDQSVWVGGEKGLFRIAPGDRAATPVVAQAGEGLGNPSVAGLLFDRQHTLWIDTGVAGLHRMNSWDGQTARFDRISERHGILNRPFGANLLEDGRGRIWTQMYVYDPKADRMSELTAVDGADLGTGWFMSYDKTSDGRMLFGGSKGILVVKPEAFDVSDFAPRLVVSELYANGRAQKAGQVLKGLQVPPEQRSFGVEFSALDFSDPNRIRYAYRLEGFDPYWITRDASSRIASYSNLDPGHYVLQVKATNRSGVWSSNELRIEVQVLPAWWQQWWFRLLATLLGLGLLGGVVHVRTRHLRRVQLELEARVRERTAELQDLTLALQRESAALHESSLTDPLTGLRNRRFLAQHIDAEVALVVRSHEHHLQHGAQVAAPVDLIFFMFDIDHFKEVNDQYGHAAGDAVIKQMRSRLLRVFRDSDFLVRWGGEEFLVVARATARAHAIELAERACAAVGELPFVLDDGTPLTKTCSVGFSCFPLSPDYPRALAWDAAVRLADACLYAIKKGGRNGWIGVLSAGASSLPELQATANEPLVTGVRSGRLVLSHSAGLEGWAQAQSQFGDLDDFS